MDAVSSKKDDWLAMLQAAQNPPSGVVAPPGSMPTRVPATPSSPMDSSDYTTMLAMGTPAVPQITPEEKALQGKLLEQTQTQNAGLQGDINNQRQLAKLREYLLEHRSQDITPMLQNLANIAGIKGDQAIAAAKPESVDDLTTKLQSAIKETSGAQDKLSDNDLNLLKMRLQFANAKGQAGAAFKTQKMYNDYYNKLAKDTNPSMATSRNGLGSPYKGLLAIDRVHGILDRTNDLNSLTKETVNEMYEALAQVVSNGSGNVSEGRVAALVPGNAAKDLAGVKQWISSKPQPAQQADFLKNVEHMLNQEKGVLTSNVRKSQQESFNGLAPIFAADPSAMLKFQALQKARGFKTDMSYDPESSLTGYTRKAAQPDMSSLIPDKSALEAEMARRGIKP